MSGDSQVVQFSTMTLENARKAKVSMENFYENLLVQDKDRNNRSGNLSDWLFVLLINRLVYRWKKLEQSMEEMGLSAEEVSWLALSPGPRGFFS